MATTYLADLVAQLRTDLGDPSGGSPRWSDAALQRAIGRSLAAFSRHHPYMQKTTIHTTLSDYAVDLATCDSWISIDLLEFPVGDKPPTFKPFTIIQNTLFMQEEGDAANCYIYWSGVHALTDSARTFDTKYSDLIELGAVAFALEQYADQTLAVKIATAIEAANTAVAKVSSKVTLAESALTSAAGVATDIGTQITNAGTQLTAAVAALAAAIAAGAGTIDAAIASKLTDVGTRVTSAGTSLTAATTALSASTTRITAAVAALASGDDYIPTANTGDDPAGKWAAYAGKDIDASNSYNNQAAAFVRQAAEHLTAAQVELSHIKAFDDKRNAYIATGSQYIAAASTYLKAAAELNSKRLSYMQIAGRHLESATAHTQEGDQLKQIAGVYNLEAVAIAAQAKAKMAAFQKEIAVSSITKKLKIIQMSAE